MAKSDSLESLLESLSEITTRGEQRRGEQPMFKSNTALRQLDLATDEKMRTILALKAARLGASANQIREALKSRTPKL